MKKILFAVSAGLFCLFTSCNNETKTSAASESSTESSQAQKNLEAHHTVVKAFQTGDMTGMDSVIGSDFVDHTDMGDKKGLDSLKAMVNFVRTTFKDMKTETVKELADDNYVMAWMHYTGTSDGKMMPPGPFDMDAIETTRFENGKAVEHWGFMESQDMAKFMQQQMQQMGKMPKKDTAAKK
jgi:predicted SnoaL-like aldol condensation-catalyzing enzyme